MNLKKENLIIMYSGGSDSRLLLELALSMKLKPYCVLFDYNQKHIKELDYARHQLETKKINYQIVKIKDLNINSGLTGNKIEGQFKNVHSMNVPSRNLIFTGLAAAIAEDKNIDTIWYGANAEDYKNKFPDCLQEWIGKVNELLNINSSVVIKLEAPLIGFSKERVLELSEYYGIDQKAVFSGYGE